MTTLELKRLPDGRLCLGGIDDGWQWALARVPELLAGDQPPAVRERLLPEPSNNTAINRDWRELIAPELQALWKANYELMAADLARLEKDPEQPDCTRIIFPENHAAAWISAINQARLTLGARWNVTEADMNRPLRKLGRDPREHDILLIHLLASVLQLFIEASL
ncbi:MAG: DUF2017 family protein [Verrucomicrobia bacterium]|nr:DUF2017 family protein [Verrucomicrobiota bacterium]